MRKPLQAFPKTERKLAILASVDVEEEGLFRGAYATADNSLKNLLHLGRLKQFLGAGRSLTLFCDYPALTSPYLQEALADLRQAGKIEIGAHLHWWNTPPFPVNSPAYYQRVPAKDLTAEIFEEKLCNLAMAAKKAAGARVTSFRMGRWDLHGEHIPLLVKNGFRQDASVRPYHRGADGGAGPDHFLAPVNPYLIETEYGNLYEYPLTVTPLFSPLLKFAVNGGFAASLPKWGLLTLLPVEHPLALMKLTTRLYYKKGGRALSLAWHSSEMMAGGAPRFQTREKCEKFLAKISSYLDWLEKEYNLTSLTLSEAPSHIPPVKTIRENGDWG